MIERDIAFLFRKEFFMNFKKVLGALAVMLAMTTVACGGGNEPAEESKPAPATSEAAPESKPASSEAAPESKPASSEAAPESKPASSEAAPASSAEPADPFLTVIPHTWTEGAASLNSNNKEYIPLADGDKVGVKISIQNYTVEGDDVESGTTLNEKGQIDPSNKPKAYLTYRLTAPKEGDYQMVMRGKVKADSMDNDLSKRGLTVRLNGASELIDIKGQGRLPLSDTVSDFVVCPTIHLTGNEDTIQITACYYRIQFDVASFLLFQEH